MAQLGFSNPALSRRRLRFWRPRGAESKTSIGMALARATMSPRLTAPVHAALQKPKRTRHSSIVWPAS
jgi:hypothetical protein